MKFSHFAARALILLLPLCCRAADPVYSNDFEAAALDAMPKELLVISGNFAVKADGGEKVLELPGEPLDSFGLLFGPSSKEGVSATARVFGTGKGRKFPTFGISVNGAGGYRLQVSPAKKALEIFKGDEARAMVPFAWKSGTWTSLRVQVRKSDAGWIVEGKAWPAEEAQPTAWTITLEEKTEPAAGRAGLWGSPYAGTPIRYDDLRIEPIP